MIALAPEHIELLVEKSLQYLEEVKKRCEENGVAINTFVREGEPHAKIINLADEVGASLIIMGTHGRKGIKRLLMGSVTERTIGYAKCPVLIIR